jgi:hypothetical protein
MLLLTLGICAGCEPGTMETAAGDETHATLRLAIGGPVADVAGVHVTLTCGDVIQGNYVPLLDAGLPPHLDPDLAGASFADWFLTTAPGPCTVSVTPMSAPGTPSVECLPTSADVLLVAGQTTEITLVIQCPTPPPAGFDLVTVINDGPEITGMLLHPAETVAPCTPVTITVEAHDPDDDALNITFEVSGSSETFSSLADPTSITVTAGDAGLWTVKATASDGFLEVTATAQFTVEDTADCP